MVESVIACLPLGDNFNDQTIKLLQFMSHCKFVVTLQICKKTLVLAFLTHHEYENMCGYVFMYVTYLYPPNYHKYLYVIIC